jgi:hypothetical protein
MITYPHRLAFAQSTLLSPNRRRGPKVRPVGDVLASDGRTDVEHVPIQLGVRHGHAERIDVVCSVLRGRVCVQLRRKRGCGRSLEIVTRGRITLDEDARGRGTFADLYNG